MPQGVCSLTEAPVNVGDNYKLTIVVKKLRYMLEKPGILNYSPLFNIIK